MRLVPEDRDRREVARVFASRRKEIEELIPGAGVEHIGATAVPGSLTKGDLDLLVSVVAERFEDAAAALSQRYSVNQPEIWSATFASFREDPAGAIPVGVQLVTEGSRDERVFLQWRDRLGAEPILLSEYNALKLAQVDADPDAYIAEKGRFIEGHVGTVGDGWPGAVRPRRRSTGG